jgi:hypothetical protein
LNKRLRKDPKIFARYERKIRRKTVNISNQGKCHVPINIVRSGKACVEAGA